MLPPPFQNALVLTGPTGSGKTALGIELAQALDAEIISMDSMALYRGMDIGTAKPTRAERALVPHHLIDVREPWESGSVAWWLEQAKRCVQEIEARGKRVLIVGGTPLYLKALLCGLFDGPPADETIRRRLIEQGQTLGSTSLHDRLAAVDPLSAARIHVNDIRRMVRALEVHELTGKPMSAWQTQWPEVRGQESGVRGQRSEVRGQKSEVRNQESDANFLIPDSCLLTPDSCLLTPVLWLDIPREQLYERINCRVQEMFAAGLVDEVRRLRGMEKPLSLEARQALGYKEIFALLDGKTVTTETIGQVQMRSRNFAKRQITWFRHLPECLPASMELTRTLWMPKMDR